MIKAVFNIFILIILIVTGCKDDQVNDNPVVPEEKYEKPTNLRVTTFTETKVVLQWDDNSDNEIGFEVEQSINGSKFDLIKTLNPNDTTIVLKGVFSSNAVYGFRVRAKFSDKYSEYSEISGTLSIFAAPSSLEILSVSDSLIELKWKTNYTNSLGFEIEQCVNLTNYGLVGVSGENYCSIKGHFNFKYWEYQFRVRAKLLTGYSGYSNVVSTVAGIHIPTELKLEYINSAVAKLSWIDNSNNETKFEIFRSTNGIDYDLIKTVGANTRSAEIVNDYDLGVKYKFKIRACNNEIKSPCGNIVEAMNLIIDMIDVQEGAFMMGNPNYPDANPVHKVTLQGFKIAKYETTQFIWQAVTGYNPSSQIGNILKPVENISYEEVQNFIIRLNQLTARNYRLPTEAEWEFAACGGNLTHGYIYSGGNDLDAVSWHGLNSSSTTHPVGGKIPNELGVYDMTGNVYELCADWYDKNY